MIMRGLPGSGKSTLARELANDGGRTIFSTDDYWFRPDEFYDFNPSLLSQAHLWTFNQVKDCIESGMNIDIILDNTNIQWKDFKKYVAIATEHGWSIDIKEPDTEWKWNVDELFKRNSHYVPKVSIKRMLDRWQSTEDIWRLINEKN